MAFGNAWSFRALLAQLALSPALLLSAYSQGSPTLKFATDEIVRPPALEIVRSENGRYSFEIRAIDGWKTPFARGTLYELMSSNKKLVWKQKLPNRFRPRQCLLSNTGFVVTFDDWEHRPSPNAIVVYDTVGRIVSNYKFEEIVKLTQLPARTVVKRAKEGLWMSGLPALDNGRELVGIPTAGMILTLDVRRGSARVAPD